MLAALASLVFAVVLPIGAATYLVSPEGKPGADGSAERPFATIQAAADRMSAGDTCVILGGTYRETVRVKGGGEAGQPLRFVAAPGETVTLSGTEPLTGGWELHQGKIYKLQVAADFEQLFVEGDMMVEARWPNATLGEMLDRSKWAHARRGSRYGVLTDPKLAETGVDWTGALATLNVTHQFYTWTRPVLKHEAGSNTFEYPRDFDKATEMRYADKTAPWEDDRYYLSGKLEALDAPTEWFLDRDTHTLYLWTADGSDPGKHLVEAKARDLAFEAEGADYLELEGLHFFGATLSLRDCDHCVVDNCHFLYPTYTRELSDLNPPATRSNPRRTEVTGDFNTVRNSSLAFSPTSGLTMAGRQLTAENNLIHDVCWTGSLRHVALGLSPGGESEAELGGVARQNTIFRGGNALINYRNQPYLIEYNHVFEGGLACKDVALVYTGQPSCAGSVVRYNWVHGCRTEEGGGLGIRGDDQTRQLTVHHNVVWNCGRDGIIVKGDLNEVHNNTVLYIGTRERVGNALDLHTAPEPVKPWRKQHPLLPVQNANTHIFNNAAWNITRDARGRPFPAGENVGNNFIGQKLPLIAPAQWDFRPAPQSPLIDAGRVIPGITLDVRGKAPDIGAYESGGPYWKPGHHNGLWIGQSGRVTAGGTRALSACLLLPPLSEVVVLVLPTDPQVQVSAGSRLRFTPHNWWKPQPITLVTRQRGPAGLRFAGASWGEVTVNLDDLRKSTGVKCWFPEPDLGPVTPPDRGFNTWRSEAAQAREQFLADFAKRRARGELRNLLTNGDFEAADLKPWYRACNQKPMPAAMKTERVREGVDGSWCVRLSCDDAELMKTGVLKWLHPLPASLKPGRYVLSYQLRLADFNPHANDGMFCSYIRTRAARDTGRNEGQTQWAVRRNQPDWLTKDCLIDIPTGAKLSYVSLQLHHATGTAWVDDVKLFACP